MRGGGEEKNSLLSDLTSPLFLCITFKLLHHSVRSEGCIFLNNFISPHFAFVYNWKGFHNFFSFKLYSLLSHSFHLEI